MAVIKSLDHVPRNSVETDEAKPPEHAFRAEMFGQKLFVAETVLQRHQHRAVVQQRRDKIDNRIVRRRLDRDQNEIARTDFLRRVVAIHFRDRKFFAFAANGQAVAPDLRQIAAHQKMHIATGMRELAAVIKSDRAGADDGDAKVHAGGRHSAWKFRVINRAPALNVK